MIDLDGFVEEGRRRGVIMSFLSAILHCPISTNSTVTCYCYDIRTLGVTDTHFVAMSSIRSSPRRRVAGVNLENLKHMGNIHNADANWHAPQPAPDAYEPFPLTEIQYAYWVGRGPNFVLGNVAPHAYFELDGKRLDPVLLSRTWRRLLDRHGALRAAVGEDGRQRVLRELPPFEVGFEDLSHAGPNELQERLATTRLAMSERVYDPAEWPLFDLKITRLAAHDRLHVSFDLLMVDLASIAQLFSEWSTLCRDEAAELPPTDVTFRDYVTALEQASETPRYRRSLDYWTSRAEVLA